MIGGTETVRLLPGEVVDRYGDPVDGTAEAVDVADVVVSPGPAPESESAGREGVTVDLTLYMPEGTTVDRGQHVEVRGHEYEVVAEPAVWTGGYLTPGQVVIEVRRAEG